MSVQQRNLTSILVFHTSGRERYLTCNPKINEQIIKMYVVDSRTLVLENNAAHFNYLVLK